ncbi:hypothetical protein M011DRAFT_156366 [Sporormia fimetaria CBS 119925]|uniref:Uncharacterized protein n=1 Tax=Sporormia fimetaria CBS 119925 TaxID=1340428 RepID=A0A6A6V4W2_9PLEO|nr:hypothetical protein M011DRAFT_156366 [Sporormia fimetaria CBS 119925]
MTALIPFPSQHCPHLNFPKPSTPPPHSTNAHSSSQKILIWTSTPFPPLMPPHCSSCMSDTDNMADIFSVGDMSPGESEQGRLTCLHSLRLRPQ